MQKITKVICGLALCASATAFASGDMFGQPATYAKGGFVVGIDGGWGYLNTPEQIYPNNFATKDPLNVSYSSTVDTGDYNWGIHVGYDFVVKPYLVLGMEMGYKDLGRSNRNAAVGIDYDDTTDKYGQRYSLSKNIHESAVDFLLTGKYFVWQGLNVFGKAGVAYVQSDTNQTFAAAGPDVPDEIAAIGTVFSGDNTIWRLRPEFALGVGYMFSNHVDVHASYDYIGGDGDDANITTALSKARVYGSNSVLAGVSYTF